MVVGVALSQKVCHSHGDCFLFVIKTCIRGGLYIYIYLFNILCGSICSPIRRLLVCHDGRKEVVV